MTGTLLNAAAILVGAGLGALVGGRVPQRVRGTVTDALGLFVLLLGVHDALGTFGEELSLRLGRAAVLVVLGSLLAGGVLGELVDVERQLNRLGAWLRDRATGGREPLAPEPHGMEREVLEGDHPPHDPQHRFVEGFVVTSLIVCVGPLAILGPLQDGLTGDYQLLAVKAMLDGFAALAFASLLGIGVAFSVLPLVVIQGSVALAAGALQEVVTAPMLAAIGAVGGFLVMGIGLRLLRVSQIRVANLLPGLVIAPVVVAWWP